MKMECLHLTSSEWMLNPLYHLVEDDRPWQDLIAVLNTKIRRLLCCYK